MKSENIKSKILLVEDNTNLSENISELLKIHDFEVVGILDNAESTPEVVLKSTPDLILIDIKLKGKKTGIDLACEIRQDFKIPIVFITSASGKEVIEKVKDLKPDGFIVKPFSRKTLTTTVDLALSNFQKTRNDVKELSEDFVSPRTDEIFIRENGWLKKIRISEILWIKAEGTYTQLFAEGKQFTLRNTAKEILCKLDKNVFIRVHKAYFINLKKIDAFNSTIVKIEESEIPIGRNYYRELTNHVNKVNN